LLLCVQGFRFVELQQGVANLRDGAQRRLLQLSQLSGVVTVSKLKLLSHPCCVNVFL
jgi:hypothetical protein